MSERAAYWRRLLGAWAQSGLSQAEFCRRQKLKAVTFAWWQRRLQERDAAGEGRPARRTGLAGHTRFVEVALPCRSSSATAWGAGSLVPPSGGYELVLAGRGKRSTKGGLTACG